MFQARRRLGYDRCMSKPDNHVPPILWVLLLLVSAPLWVHGLLPVLLVLYANPAIAAVVMSIVASGLIYCMVRWVNRHDSRPPVDPPGP